MENIKFSEDSQKKFNLPDHAVVKGNNMKPVIVNGMVMGYAPFPTTVRSATVDIGVRGIIDGTDPTTIKVLTHLYEIPQWSQDKGTCYKLFMYVGWNEEVQLDKVIGAKVSPAEVSTIGGDLNDYDKGVE